MPLLEWILLVTQRLATKWVTEMMTGKRHANFRLVWVLKTLQKFGFRNLDLSFCARDDDSSRK